MRRVVGVVFWVILIVLRSTEILVSGSDSTGNSSSSSSIPSESLDAVIREYANKSLKQPRSGTVYNVSLPARYSGLEVSVVRLRRSSFWSRGVNFSYFHIPPRIVPRPYVKRLFIVFENLHNLSSRYYRVPGYELVAPVVGFSAYDASNPSLLGSQKLNLTIKGYPISIRFPPFPETYTNGSVRCVTFGLGTNNSFEFSNMTLPNVCLARHQGHFSLAVPLVPPDISNNEGNRLWKWWVVGFVAGFAVLVVSVLSAISIRRLVVKRKIKEMEKQSDRDVPLDTFYVGRCKMPSASMVRTQPSGIENEHVP